MKKALVFLLAAVLLCVSLTASAEKNKMTIEIDSGKYPVVAADDPCLDAFRAEGEKAAKNALPVIFLPLNRNRQLQVVVKPGSVQNKKFSLSVKDEKTVRVRGVSLTGLKAGETVLTVTSEEDKSVKAKYRVIVVKPVTRITVSASKQKVGIGKTATVKASFEPKNTAVQGVVWSSSNEQVATVDQNGKVTGVKRGSVRITALAKDGSFVRGTVNLQVVQEIEKIKLDRKEVTVGVGRNVSLKADVSPKDANDKQVVWSSSDEKIATVNAYGKITGVKVGDCEIICSSKNGEVKAAATVHVQQPVKSITFGKEPVIYVGETGTLSWTVDPANASNKSITLSSSNENVLKVNKDGTIQGISAGSVIVRAVSTDGTNKRAQIRIKVLQHVEGVRMRRKTAYIDVGETAKTSAVLLPSAATNHNMTWKSADTSIATVKQAPGEPGKVMITGVKEGETTVTGTTEDGGFQASIQVRVGSWSRMARISYATISGKGKFLAGIRNASGMILSEIKVEIEAYKSDGTPAAINKNGSNKVTAVYGRAVYPGKTTIEDGWTLQDYNPEVPYQRMTVRLVEYRIENDWVKLLRTWLRPSYEYKP